MIFLGLIVVSIAVGYKTDQTTGWLVFGIGCLILGLLDWLSGSLDE